MKKHLLIITLVSSALLLSSCGKSKAISKKESIYVNIDKYANNIEIKWKKSGHVSDKLGYVQLEVDNTKDSNVISQTLFQKTITIKCKKEYTNSEETKYSCENSYKIKKDFILKNNKENLIKERGGVKNNNIYVLGTIKSNKDGGFTFNYK